MKILNYATKAATPYVLVIAISGLTLYILLRRIGVFSAPTPFEKDLEKAGNEVINDALLWDVKTWRNYPEKALPEKHAENLASHIYNAFGFFNDDEEKIYASFRAMSHRINVSQIADAFAKRYKKDLLFTLESYLNSTEMQKVAYIIKNKP